jgi:hypothetical protein
MRKCLASALLLALLWLSPLSAPAGAQEQDDGWNFHMADTYARGDQTINISLGVIFPMFFFFRDNEERLHGHGWGPVGGAGFLAYNYFLGPNIFIGGEIGFKFNSTVGGNIVFLVPIGARAGWQFTRGRFEFPIALTVGVAPQRILEFDYFGFFAKAGASGFYRFTPEWSFGLNADFSWYPQRPRAGRLYNVDATILGVTIAARYHF